MREILFRGKKLNNSEWVVGNLCKSYFKIEDTCICCTAELAFYSVDPATVGQYTGLKDKNGKRIFEGDILLMDDIKGYVNYGTGCFCVKMSDPDYLFRNNPAIDIILNEYPGLEVIGNIHDNPEQMEGAGA